MEYGYDLQNRLVTIDRTGVGRTTVSYDAATGKVSSVREFGAGASDAYGGIDLTYTATTTTVTDLDGAARIYVHDPDGIIASRLAVEAAADATDNSGQISWDWVNNTAAPGGADALTSHTYRYRTNGGQWSAWLTTSGDSDPSVDAAPLSPDDHLDIELNSTTTDGSYTTPTATASLTVADDSADSVDPAADDPDGDPSNEPTSTDDASSTMGQEVRTVRYQDGQIVADSDSDRSRAASRGTTEASASAPRFRCPGSRSAAYVDSDKFATARLKPGGVQQSFTDRYGDLAAIRYHYHFQARALVAHFATRASVTASGTFPNGQRVRNTLTKPDVGRPNPRSDYSHLNQQLKPFTPVRFTGRIEFPRSTIVLAERELPDGEVEVDYLTSKVDEIYCVTGGRTN